MKRTLGWAADAVEGSLKGGEGEQTFDLSLVQTDSRECVAGSTYVARVGEDADGHDYARQALDAGAIAFIVERPLEDIAAAQIIVPDSTVALGKLARKHLKDLRETTGIKVVGITGSAGKTTTKDLLAGVLSHFGDTVAPLLSFNNEVGLPLTVLEADLNTDYLVLEMGASGPGHLTYLTEIAPLDVAVVLLVGRAHLEGFGDEATLAKSKKELLSGLLPGGTAVLNEDDPDVAEMATNRHTTIFFSAEGFPAQVRAENVFLSPTGHAHFTLLTPDYEGEETLSLLGHHQVSNALAVVSAALALGLETKEVAPLVAKAKAGSPHRMALHHVDWEDRGLKVLDDSYNANPDSMKASFEAARALGSSSEVDRLVLVLGEMLELGERSPQIHAEVGEAAQGLGPGLVLLVGEGARAYRGGLGETPVKEVADPTEAVATLLGEARAGDLILVKGSNGSGVWRVADHLLAGPLSSDMKGGAH